MGSARPPRPLAVVRRALLCVVPLTIAFVVLLRFNTRFERTLRVSWMRLWLPESKCSKLPGYAPIDESPIRSPLVVADHLIEYTRGKTFMEIGTRHGDISACVARVSERTTRHVLSFSSHRRTRRTPMRFPQHGSFALRFVNPSVV